MKTIILIISVLIIAVLVSSGCTINDTAENDINYFKTLCHTFTSFQFDEEKNMILSNKPIIEKVNSQVSWELDMEYNMYSKEYYADCRKGSKQGENLNYYYCPSNGYLKATITVIDSDGNILLVYEKDVIVVIVPKEITGETWKTTTKCL